MAKAGQLAGLAALGALAYMNRDKLGFGGDSTGPAATSQELGASQARTDAQRNAMSGNMGPDTGDETDRLAARYGKTTGSTVTNPSAPTTKYSNVGTPGSAQTQVYRANAPTSTQINAPKVVSKPSDQSIKLAPESQNQQSDLRSSRGSVASTENVDYGNEGNTDVLTTLNKKSGANTPSARTSDALKVESLKNTTRNSLNKKSGADTPSERTSDALNVQSLKNKKNADALKRATQSTLFKQGGAVKKMASGGMTSKVSSASSRADGIATKGKTRGKIY